MRADSTCVPLQYYHTNFGMSLYSRIHEMQLHETDKTSSYWMHLHQLCPLLEKWCITNAIDHSPHGLSATGLPATCKTWQTVPREAAECWFLQTYVRRGHRPVLGQGTDEGQAVQRWDIAAV
jgi:hypothetical protein